MILGLTFKEDCPDIRNSKAVDIVRKLNEYGIESEIVEPWADDNEAYHEYNVHLTEMENVRDVNCVVTAVAHKQFRESGIQLLKQLFGGFSKEKVLIDVKGIYNRKELEESNLN